MPMSWGARGGYTATFTDGALEATSTMGFDGKPTGTVTGYTPDGVHDRFFFFLLPGCSRLLVSIYYGRSPPAGRP